MQVHASSWFIDPDDMGYVPFNKFSMTIETTQYSSNGRQFLIKEQELKHTNSVFENLKIQNSISQII